MKTQHPEKTSLLALALVLLRVLRRTATAFHSPEALAPAAATPFQPALTCSHDFPGIPGVATKISPVQGEERKEKRPCCPTGGNRSVGPSGEHRAKGPLSMSQIHSPWRCAKWNWKSLLFIFTAPTVFLSTALICLPADSFESCISEER